MKKILLVSGHEYIQSLIKKEIEKDGYQVLTASNRNEALSQLTSTFIKPDLVILDLRVHDKNESETLGHVIKHKFKLPVIIFPARSIFKRDALSTEADAGKIKSSDISALRKKIHELTSP